MTNLSRMLAVPAILFVAILAGCSPDTSAEDRANATTSTLPASSTTSSTIGAGAGDISLSSFCSTTELEARISSTTVDSMQVALTSKTDRTCTLQGRPTISFYEDETAIATEPAVVTEELGPSVTLTRGTSAYFTANFEPGTNICAEATSLHIAPPTMTETLIVPLAGEQQVRVCATDFVSASQISGEPTS